MSQAALIFSHSITPRLQYVVDFLSRFYGLTFRLTSDEEKYRGATDECKINYSYHRLLKEELFIHSHVLLTESSIRPVKVECYQQPFFRGMGSFTAFFRAEGDLGFDLFAAIFYLITRYEEYLPHKKDKYGRFDHTQSLAHREQFLHQPLVNVWLEDLRDRLMRINPDFERRARRFHFLPTYDIDMAWSFRNKGFKRNAGGLASLFLRLKFRRFVQRIGVLRRKRIDPYDAYEWMDRLHQEKGLQPIYFFLMARERGRYDKNIDIANPEFRVLVQSLSAQYTIGLHPSWISGDQPALLAREKAALEALTSKPVLHSRQHYIRMDLPATYQRLIQQGIEHDYSMGYGTINGFRASITSPYLWYDLKSETATKLTIHPFCFMDANAFYEMYMDPEDAEKELFRLLHAVRNVYGELVTIWHNSFLGNDPALQGWKQLYEKFVAKATEKLGF